MSNSLAQVTSPDVVDRFPECRLFCRLDGIPPAERLTQRLQALQNLQLMDANNVAVFDEATETACRFLAVPICILSIADATTEYFKAASGLSQLGLTNPLVKARQLDLVESLSASVIENSQVLVLHDVQDQPAIAASRLVQEYGIRSFASVPLITAMGDCIGSLTVMDFQIHSYSQQAIAFLEMTARWSLSEYERTLLHDQQGAPGPVEITPQVHSQHQPLQSMIDSVRLQMIGQLTQDLRSPLTSVMGMASMLSREIYGPLTDKQREYTEIVRNSSQTLMALVEEIIELGDLDDSQQQLDATLVDIEMLGQQVLKTLEPIAQKREQALSLTVEPGPRAWVLDKTKVKQLLYHLVFSVIQMAGESSTVRVHASRRDKQLKWSVWLSNPWLGEGLPQSALKLCQMLDCHTQGGFQARLAHEQMHSADMPANSPGPGQLPLTYSREVLGLLLSRHLTEIHGGQLTIQGSLEAGYRFVVSLPYLSTHPQKTAAAATL